MKVAVLHFEDAILSSVTGPFDILSKTNAILNNFDVESKVIFETQILSNSNFLSVSTTSFNDTIYDLIIVPAMFPDVVDNVLQKENKIIEWIAWQYTEGAEIASICFGTFLVAASGILNGKAATTHWLGAELFQKLFPQIALLDDKIIVDNHRIYSCGGAFSYTSLLIYLIEKYCGRHAAVMISKIFMIHLHDTQQQSYAILNLQKNHTDNQIKSAQKLIEENYQTRLTANKIADHIHMSVRTLIRRFKKATGNTPYEYLQRVRIEAAKKILEKSEEGVEQISFKIGYEDHNAFRKLFKRIVGITPIEYKKRYSKIFAEDYVKSMKSNFQFVQYK